MSHVLTQDEIDALMAAINEGSAGETGRGDRGSPAWRPYDFADPPRDPAGRMPGLLAVHENFGRWFGAALTHAVRRTADVAPGDLRAVKLGAFLDGMAPPPAIYLFQMRPAPGVGAIAFDGALAFALVNLFLGGAGPERRRAADRGLTAIERPIVRRVAATALAALDRALAPFGAGRVEWIDDEPAAPLAAVGRAAENVLAFESRVQIVGDSGAVRLALPFAMIEPLRRRLAADWLGAGPLLADDEWREALGEAVRDAAVTVVARLGDVDLTVAEFADLQPGQILELDKFFDDLVEVAVEERPMFRAEPAVARGRKAVKIV